MPGSHSWPWAWEAGIVISRRWRNKPKWCDLPKNTPILQNRCYGLNMIWLSNPIQICKFHSPKLTVLRQWKHNPIMVSGRQDKCHIPRSPGAYPQKVIPREGGCKRLRRDTSLSLSLSVSLSFSPSLPPFAPWLTVWSLLYKCHPLLSPEVKPMQLKHLGLEPPRPCST